MSKIQDYALIGNCRSAALVSKNAAIDWLCWPRFDSQPFFARLLDESKGSWSIFPTEPYESSARYIEHTNVLQTSFITPTGKTVITDLMPIVPEEQKHKGLYPEQELLRKVHCVSGEMEMELNFCIPFEDYVHRSARGSELIFGWLLKDGLVSLCSPIALDVQHHLLKATWKIHEGEVLYFSLTFNQEMPAVLPAVDFTREETVQSTIEWWKDFAFPISYQGEFEEEVIRSALVLKLLSYNPSGAIIASPTTSLPERVGADLNWDYRYCWLRDASLTTSALIKLNLKNEAMAFGNWLLHTTNLTRPKLKVLYDVYGRTPQSERIDTSFFGYFGSKPVRFGNAASEQDQLDLYGEVIHGAYQILIDEEYIDEETQRMLRELGQYICEHWHEEDAGIWEVRGHKEHFTHSLILCWAGLNDLLELHDKGLLRKLDADKFSLIRTEIAHTIEELAWNPALESYVSQLRGDKVDASLLLMPWYRFSVFDSVRMQKTYERIEKDLMAPNGLLYRNHDVDEGVFVICSLWAVEYLADAGRISEARELLENILDHGNHVGLFSEEIDPITGDFLGNFPVTFSHLGIINAALAISEAEKKCVSVDDLEGCIL